MAVLATRSNPRTQLPEALTAEIERRRAGLARHMARAVVTLVRWDSSTGTPPEREAIARACEAGLDLFIAAARDSRPPTQAQMRRVAQLGILQARSSQSVEPVLAAYRIAARVAWDAIFRAWRGHPEATPEAVVAAANYVFAALDQVAALVTHTYLAAREQHLLRGTRARARLFHALISDTFDSEISVRKQALALNLALASGYVAAVCRVTGDAAGARGGELLADLAGALALPARSLVHAADPDTMSVLWPADGEDPVAALAEFARSLQAELETRTGGAGHRVRIGLGGQHPGLRGVSRSYLEAQQALDIGRRLWPERAVHNHESVIPHLILAQNPLQVERFVQHELGPLMTPEAERSHLLETLRAHIENGSVKDAAAALGLHRHTVIYRLEKIRELCGDVDSPAARQALGLALDLLKLI